jgi:hypothetical protein
MTASGWLSSDEGEKGVQYRRTLEETIQAVKKAEIID